MGSPTDSSSSPLVDRRSAAHVSLDASRWASVWGMWGLACTTQSCIYLLAYLWAVDHDKGAKYAVAVAFDIDDGYFSLLVSYISTVPRALSMLLSGRYALRIPVKKWALVVSGVIAVAGLVVWFSWRDSPMSVTVAVVLINIGHGVFSPVSAIVCAELFDEDELALPVGIILTSTYFGCGMASVAEEIANIRGWRFTIGLFLLLTSLSVLVLLMQVSGHSTSEIPPQRRKRSTREVFVEDIERLGVLRMSSGSQRDSLLLNSEGPCGDEPVTGSHPETRPSASSMGSVQDEHPQVTLPPVTPRQHSISVGAESQSLRSGNQTDYAYISTATTADAQLARRQNRSPSFTNASSCEVGYRLFSSPLLVLLLVGSSVRFMAGLSLQYLPSFYTHVYPHRVRAFAISNAVAVALCGASSQVVGGQLTQTVFRNNTATVPAWSCLFAGLATCAVVLLQNFQASICMLFVMWLLGEAWFPGALASVQRELPPGTLRDTGVGLFFAMTNCAGALGTFMLGHTDADRESNGVLRLHMLVFTCVPSLLAAVCFAACNYVPGRRFTQ